MINKYKILQTKNLLYVEDDLELQAETKEILKIFFNKIYTASNGESGYGLFLDNPIDVILVDINMPELNGIEMIKLVRKDDENIPIAIISAFTNTDYLLESIELTLTKYLVKPLTTKKIIQLLDKLLEFFMDNIITLNKDWQINLGNCQIKSRDNIINLTKKEGKFMEILAKNSIVTYDMLNISIWEYDKMPSDNAVRSFIRKLRKKMPIDCIKNKQGVGYYLDI